MDVIAGGAIHAFWPVLDRAIELYILLSIRGGRLDIVTGSPRDDVPVLLFNGLNVSLFIVLLIVIGKKRRVW
ncbi:MAG: hypothetical protein QXH51_05500 [Candidatus Bathyarchaeia archaeon]